MSDTRTNLAVIVAALSDQIQMDLRALRRENVEGDIDRAAHIKERIANTRDLRERVENILTPADS